jgi:beta-galactosidase/beta-glucuronidase
VNSAHAYPRPQLVRSGWLSLNGPWDFAFDPDARWRLPTEVSWTEQITVPFAPETAASGLGDTGFYCACWYKRSFEAPSLGPGERLVLHFGAVDYAATVWVNGFMVAEHRGGYTPFKADLTPYLGASGPQTVVVRAEDDPHDLAKPRGKQDWLLEPHSIWYPRTTGIWQTVWLETLPATAIGKLRWTANLERWEIALDAVTEGLRRDDLRLHVKLTIGDLVLADDSYAVISGEVHRRIALSDPGIDDYRNELLWSPSRPTLIEAKLELRDQRGERLDAAASYTALRSVTTQEDRFLLNGRPYPLRLVLDQGYWPGTGITAPSDEALRRDVELAKAMGFNGVRKHQKIEDPRYLYWADQLGLLVWEEMPSAYRFRQRSVERLTSEWMEAVTRDFSHPCIVAWVPINESWGVPDLPHVANQRHYLQALYHLTKTLDPERPVIGNDGWESTATDIIGIHDYEDDLEVLRHRYQRSHEVIPHLFRRERPAGRLLTLEGHQHQGQPIMLSEFGGVALAEDGEATWGYTLAKDAEDFQKQYGELLEAVRSFSLLAGFCYTQFADTFQEANGLLYEDRRPKFPIEAIALATAGKGKPYRKDQPRRNEHMIMFRRDLEHAAAEEASPEEERDQP